MIWVDTQDAFDRALDRLTSQPVVAIDTEADSLHSYFDKVCLIQLSAGGEDVVVDPLKKLDLAKFGGMLADPNVTKVLHGGDYDLRILNRDFGFVINNLVDTMICAQLLGYEAFGLAALLERHFGVKLNKAHQRADWAMRPLPPDMLAYAAMDTHYLSELAAKLRTELEALGRWEWAKEEFARLENVRYRDGAAEENPEPWRKLKNIGNLDRRSLAIIRELHAWRDARARAADRPAFKIIGNDAVIDIAKEKPITVPELAKIKSVARYHVDRFGRELTGMVAKAMALPEEELPERAEARPWSRDKELEARVERMKKVRDRIAAELKIDTAVLAPRHVLTAVASSGSLDVPAMREWQKKVAGEALLAVVQPNRKLF